MDHEELADALWAKVFAPLLGDGGRGGSAQGSLEALAAWIGTTKNTSTAQSTKKVILHEFFSLFSALTPTNVPALQKDGLQRERGKDGRPWGLFTTSRYHVAWDTQKERMRVATSLDEFHSLAAKHRLVNVDHAILSSLVADMERAGHHIRLEAGEIWEEKMQLLLGLALSQLRLTILLAATSSGPLSVSFDSDGLSSDEGGCLPSPVPGITANLEILPVFATYDGDAFFQVRAQFIFLGDTTFGQAEGLLRKLNRAFEELAGPLPIEVVPPDGRVPRRSIMSPVPVPRATLADANVLAFTRGVGRMFSGYSKVPDLDRLEETAVQEASQHFWAHVDEGFRGVPCTKKEGVGGKEILTVHVEETKARFLWAKIVSSLNASSDGPGVEVEAPSFESASFFTSGEVVKATNITLWPDPPPSRDTWRRPLPPVRFRRESSPGYRALLERAAGRPYFADGWLWVPRAGAGREGFRIGGLSSLLFPEGRAALERLRKREIGDSENELQRIFRNPTLFPDEDRRVVRDLEDAIARAKDWLQELSAYDIGPDLLLCIFEAFHRQLVSWREEKVSLSDGKQISTSPYRIIRLDPQELRLRLDPGETWGRNWRGRLFSKLEALTTFQRQSRDTKGRKVDVGDRFLGRVIDGLQGVSEGGAEAHDVGLGLTRLLKREGAFPLDAFFVDVSLDFMANLWAFSAGGEGMVRNAIEEARAAEQKARALPLGEERSSARRRAAELRQEARAKPYYQHSPRLLTLGNLRDWPRWRKELAWTLLAEITPAYAKTARGRRRRIPGHSTITVGETTFLCCNGKGGRGYKVKTWIKKVSTYERRTGPQGGAGAFKAFVEDLQELGGDIGLMVDLSGQRGADAIATLKAYQSNPAHAYDLPLKAYLPQDLEARLRESLHEAGIEALDEGEGGARHKLTTATREGGLSPADIRVARTMAGWKQADLAQRLGVSQTLVSYWENGKKAIPEEGERALLALLAPHLSTPNV